MSPKVDERRPLLQEDDNTPSYQGIATRDAGIPPPSSNGPKSPEKQLNWVLLALWSAVFLGALDSTIVATLLTSVGSYFERAHQALYIGTAYLLTGCCFTSVYGRLSDIIGRKGAMILAQALFATGTLLCGIAPSMNWLIAARAIAGIGGGGLMSVTTIIITDLIPLKQRGLYQGLGNIVFGLGTGLGGPLGGFINDHFNWRWAFLFQVPLLAISIILVLAFVDGTSPQQAQTTRKKLQRIDYLGSLTLVLSVGGILLALTLKASEELPWSNPWVWGLLTGGSVSLVTFVLVEALVVQEPILPLHLLLRRTPFCVSVVMFLQCGIGFSLLYNAPIFFTAVKLMSAQDAGLRLVPASVTTAIGSVAAGLYMRRTGKFWKLILFSGSLTILSYVLMLFWNPSIPTWHLWIDPLYCNFGAPSVITAALIALIASVHRDELAVVTGVFYLARSTGQVVAVALSGALLQSLLTKNLHARITGPGSEELIQRIRHSTTIIPELDPQTRQAAVESYSLALRAIFIAQAVAGVLALLASIPIEENPLPATLLPAQQESDAAPAEEESA